MQLSKSIALRAIVLTILTFGTGCAQLMPGGKSAEVTPPPDKQEETASAASDDSLWNRLFARPPADKRPSVFFNEQSRQIEKNLGY